MIDQRFDLFLVITFADSEIAPNRDTTNHSTIQGSKTENRGLKLKYIFDFFNVYLYSLLVLESKIKSAGNILMTWFRP